MNNEIIVKYFQEFSSLKNFKINPINKEMFSYYYSFVDNKEALITALVHTPFTKTKNLNKIKENFGNKVYSNILHLNKIYDQNKNILNNLKKYREIIILFLIHYKFLLKEKKNYKINTKLLQKKRIQYAFELLRNIDVYEIREELEDELFKIISPNIYNNYHSLIRLSRIAYKEYENKIKNELEKLLKKKDIRGKIQSRFKSIYSIHYKITSKNILLSQVLDVIGLRIVVEKESECYMIMESILTNWTVINSKIKDYISVPKNNGYKSIHLTILIETYPVEIQIRTYDMHYHSQYGRASHCFYKNYH